MDSSAYQKFREIDRGHFWKISRRRLIMEWLQRLLRGNNNLRILDIGGACSILSSDMRILGNVTVIEPDKDTVKAARGLFQMDIREGSLPHDLPVEGLYDLVTLLDVLEHVEDDQEALQAIWKTLKPGGIFVCTVPACQWLWSNLDIALHHKRRYNYFGLSRLLRGAGFKIRRLSYYTSLLFPITVAHRLTKKLMPPKDPQVYDVHLLPPVINDLSCAIMSIERFILRYIDLPVGSSLIAVCLRPEYTDTSQQI